MSRGPEANFWNMLKKSLKSRKALFSRIENRSGGGIPDTYIVDCGIPYWLELKVEKRGRALVSPNQNAWNASHWEKGGSSFYLVRTKDQASKTFVYLFAGSAGSDLMDNKCVNVEYLYYGPDLGEALDLARKISAVRASDAALRS